MSDEPLKAAARDAFTDAMARWIAVRNKVNAADTYEEMQAVARDLIDILDRSD